MVECCGHAFQCCPGCVVVVALFVDSGQSKFLGEWAQEDGAVVGVSWPLPSGLASDIKCTLLATPLQHTGMALYLVDVQRR